MALSISNYSGILLVFVTCIYIKVVSTVPPPVHVDEDYRFLSVDLPEDDFSEPLHHRSKRKTDTAQYKYYWVTQCGYFREKPVGLPALEVAATMNTTEEGHLKAVKLIYRMTRFMPARVFIPLTEMGSVGIFSVSEVIGDFPEFARTKNTEKCGKSCALACRLTCTSDGRKIDSLTGYGGTRAVVREDNVLCGSTDPYGGTLNVLSHEFAHTINFRALNASQNLAIRQAYSNVASKWVANTYATSNRREYFAEAVTSYFLTSLTSERLSGGMNLCGDEFCTDEWVSRNNLKTKDPEIYALVDEIFTDFRVYLEGRIGICGW